MPHEHSSFESSPPTGVRWIVLGLVAFAAASAYLTRYCISAANTSMQQDLGLNDAQMGQLMGAFMLGYLLFQVPGGWLGSRWGTRAAFSLISLCWSLCNVLTGLASLLGALWISRFLLGVFQAGMVPISARIVKDWIPLSNRGMSSAGIGAAMSLGGAFTLWLTGLLLSDAYSWRGIFVAYSLVSILWAVGFWWYFRTDPRHHGGVNQAELHLIQPADPSEAVSKPEDSMDASARSETNGHAIGWQVALAMLQSASMWGLCVQSFFRAAGYTFFVTWFFAFLEYAYGIPKDKAGFLNSLPLMAIVVGSLTGGWTVDRLLRATGSRWISRSGTAIVSMGLCGVFTLASAWTSTATQFSTVIAMGALFSGLALPTAWAATIDVGGRHTSLAMGVMNMAGGLAGVILPIILGNWFDHIRHSEGDWNQVIILHAAFYFVGMASWFLVNPDREISLTKGDDGQHAV